MGCSCAGPYGHRLLGIDLERSHEFEREITRGCEGIKPGWVRVNFNYFIDDDTFDYIVDAVALLADEGRKLLPYYRFEPDTGLWVHRDGLGRRPAVAARRLLRRWRDVVSPPTQLLPDGGLPEYLDAGPRAARRARRGAPPTRSACPSTTNDFEHLRWFPYPDEESRRRGG